MYISVSQYLNIGKKFGQDIPVLQQKCLYLGKSYWAVGDTTKTLECSSESRSIFRHVSGNRKDIVVILNNLGATYSRA